MEREITKAFFIRNADNSQEMHIHFNGMYVRTIIELSDKEIKVLDAIIKNKNGKSLLKKICNSINQIEL